MKTKPSTPVDIDEYIDGFPDNVQSALKKIRAIIHEIAPDAKEVIRYQIPTFVLNGNLVHFAAYKNHIGFYPAPSGIEAFRNELADYETAKGTVKFPLNKPIPYELIAQIVEFRKIENLAKPKRTK
jgi:uncharacterized protein YdhG (YjbR/CyaY superfamily)